MALRRRLFIMLFTSMNKFTKPSPAELEHSLKAQEIEAGWFGKIFGLGELGKIHITASSMFMLILSGILFVFWKDFNNGVEYWKIITPLLTLGFGYIWGKKE